MRKLALVLTLLPLAACSSFGWDDTNGNVPKEQKERGIRDVSAMSNEYETRSFYRSLRRRSDGRNNAFGRDMTSIADFLDRHLWNYDVNDPYVNFPSNTTKFEHLGRFALTGLTAVPGVDEITNR